MIKKNNKKNLKTVIKNHVESCFDTHHGQLRRFPNSVIIIVYVMCLNILFQGFLDLILKFGGYTPFVTSMPWRIDFLFLTAISVLMGFQTLNGMKQMKLDVTRNSVQVGLLVEMALIVGDLHFISIYEDLIPDVTLFRAPFIVLTFVNVFILLYVSKKMNLFWENGKIKLY